VRDIEGSIVGGTSGIDSRGLAGTTVGEPVIVSERVSRWILEGVQEPSDSTKKMEQTRKR